MAFSKEWDDLYQSSQHMSIWPWSDLVSYVHRYAKPSAGYQRVLELGCGAGANIPFFLKMGVDYYAIEGSPTIVHSLHQTYPVLTSRVVAGDFTKSIPFPGVFDLVVDRVSLAHNTTQDMKNALQMVYKRLRGGGKFIGIDWFSEKHMDAGRGEPVDSHTRKDLPESSHLAGTGMVHFCDKQHLIGLLEGSGFVVDRLEHKISEIHLPSESGQLAWWNFVATKPQK